MCVQASIPEVRACSVRRTQAQHTQGLAAVALLLPLLLLMLGPGIGVPAIALHGPCHAFSAFTTRKVHGHVLAVLTPAVRPVAVAAHPPRYCHHHPQGPHAVRLSHHWKETAQR